VCMRWILKGGVANEGGQQGYSLPASR